MLGPVELVDEVDSTNRVLLDRARAGAPEGAVLVADHQSAGRGRLDRRWESAPGASLLVSVLLRPTLPVARLHLLTVAAGLAARDACLTVAGVGPGLKWPNDLVVEEGGITAKLAGLLAETVITAGRVEAVVVGMGMNLHDIELPLTATSLDRLAGRPVDRAEVLDAWLAAFDRRYGALLVPGGEEALADEHRAACVTLGQHVRVELPSGELTGLATDVTPSGHLVVAGPDGPVEVAAGDVVHLRPT